MLIFSFILQALHIFVWILVLVGSILLLRRGYTSAGISMFLGAAIAGLMATVNLSFAACQVTGWIKGVDVSRMMMMVGLASAVGSFLFALGFLQLTRTIGREG